MALHLSSPHNPQTGTPTGPAADATLAQLADYTDTGTPQYATTGWNTGAVASGYTGQGTDPTAGLTTFHARNYDPSTSTFTGHDTWGGLLRAPRTLNHYAYTLNNPATLKDHLGNDPIEADGTDWNSVSPETYGYQDDWTTPTPPVPAPSIVSYFAPPTPGPWASGYVYSSTPANADPNGGNGVNIAPQPATPMQKFINNTIQSPEQASQAQLSATHRDWFHQSDYSYHLENWLGINLDQYSAASIAKVFREHPDEIFPFKVEGCSSFTDGASCRLIDAAPSVVGDGSGTVRVSTTDTSVTFTVTSNDYFDAPGSTIRFDIVKREDGYYLDQTANATGADNLTALGINLFGAERIAWTNQEANLRQAVLKYGQK